MPQSIFYLLKVPSEESSIHNCHTLEQTLTRLGLQQYLEILLAENVDLDSLVICRHAHFKQHQRQYLIISLLISFPFKALCQDSDLKELGIPLGPRKKILNFMRRRWLSEVRHGLAFSSFCLYILQLFLHGKTALNGCVGLVLRLF